MYRTFTFIMVALACLMVCSACVVPLGFIFLNFANSDGATLEEGRANAEPLIAALEAYRQANGEYPAQLEELVPTYFAEIPRPAARYSYFYIPCTEEPGYVLAFVQGNDSDNACGGGPDSSQWICVDSEAVASHFTCAGEPFQRGAE